MPIMTRRMIAASLAAALAVLPAACVPYAYPNLACVPPVRVDADADQVHAFRVVARIDVEDADRNADDVTLSRVTVSDEKRVRPQADVSLEHGVYVIGIALNYTVHHGHDLSVRLYRRGYDTVVVGAGDDAKFAWKEAPDLASRERAIEALLAPPIGYNMQARVAGHAVLHTGTLAPGSRSRAHREALLFAASEYEHLAEVDPAGERLRHEAQELRARAAE
jgi:hypothetical protein